jgi:hypothetical protein
MMGVSSVDVLREAFPGRVALSPSEIALVLYGSATRKRVERVRNELDAGVLVPGLTKTGARWLVPVVALGAALDARARNRVATPAPVVSSGGVGRKCRSSIGPRLF